MQSTVTTYSELETRRAGAALAAELPEGALVALSGDLGTGKTAFIRGVCAYFNCADQVSSPSFTIVNEYSGTRPVTHCDLYRLETIDEMLQIGLDDVFGSGRTVLVEWAERALPLLPFPRYEVAAHHGSRSEERSYTILRRDRDDGSAGILYAPEELVFRRKP